MSSFWGVGPSYVAAGVSFLLTSNNTSRVGLDSIAKRAVETHGLAHIAWRWFMPAQRPDLANGAAQNQPDPLGGSILCQHHTCANVCIRVNTCAYAWARMASCNSHSYRNTDVYWVRLPLAT
jgi:hypothetical protein